MYLFFCAHVIYSFIFSFPESFDDIVQMIVIHNIATSHSYVDSYT